MGRCLDHRGPDEEGAFSYADERIDVHFAHRRLSIIDLQHGQQPLVKHPFVLCYNGELYNFREIRAELVAGGARFSTTSDTEVVLEAWRRWGPGCLRRFRGMFAFAVLDQSTGSLFLARDQFGIKPLHYIRRKDGVVFASELKALVNSFGSELHMQPEALVASMLYYWVPDQMCSVQGVEKLQPGTWAEFRPDGTHRVERYWDVVEEASAAAEEHYDLREVVEDSVRAHLVADVPVSSFLSGGLDSSIVTVLAKQANPQIDAYTITFRAEDNRLEAMPDDAVYARKVAQRHGIDLHEIEIQPDVVGLLPRMVDILDEPIGDPAAINTLLMSEAARDAGVKVLLSGMGADELFGGYRKHVACMMAGRYRELPGFVHRSTNGVVERLPLTAAGRGLRYSRWAKRFVTFAELPEEAAFRRSYSLYAPAELAAFLSPELQRDVDTCRGAASAGLRGQPHDGQGQPHVPGRHPDVPPRPQSHLHGPGQHGCIDRGTRSLRGHRGLPGRVLALRQGQGLRQDRKGRIEACRRGVAPQGDRAPAQGVVLGSAPGMGVQGPEPGHRRLAARWRPRQHRVPPPAGRFRSGRRAPSGPRRPIEADLAVAHARDVVPPDSSSGRRAVTRGPGRESENR